MSTRSINKYFLLGTMALTGMVGFTACSSDEVPDNGKQNPTYNNGTVKTQFALNVPQSGRNSRMTAGNTQQTGFRDISDMRLLSFGETVEPGTNALNQIVLGSSENAYEADKYRRVYRDVVVPVGTKNFVFYGTATRTNADKDATVGALKRPSWDNLLDLANVNFQLVPIDQTIDLGSTAEALKILQALNKVAGTSIGEGNNQKKWSSASASSSDLLEKQAGTLYTKFTGLKAGSYASVKATLDELINAAGKSQDENSLLGAIVKNANEALALLVDDQESGLLVTQFPGKYNLPDGVAQIKWDEDANEFEYVANSETAISNANKINYNKITYPAELDYTINTPVKASDNVKTGLDGWPAYDNWSIDKDGIWPNKEWTGEVTANTRSIGLEKAVQYAVATLQTQVRANSATLSDDAANKGQRYDNQIPVTKNGKASFWFTGILIGGQPNNVGWNYLPVAQAGSELAYDNTIYDNQLNEAVQSTIDIDGTDKITGYKVTTADEPTKNYTLVLDNNNSAEQAHIVYVTLEFVNNSGIDFYGQDGVIPNGGKFYLVGKLDVDATSTQNPNGVDRIFKQDYMTKAKFSIGNLKHAYNCIPDLRSSSISLGLAVNLTWENGMSFSDVIE